MRSARRFWLSESIKDDGLAAEVARIEKDHADGHKEEGVAEAASAALTRSAVKAAIERQYTAPR